MHDKRPAKQAQIFCVRKIILKMNLFSQCTYKQVRKLYSAASESRIPSNIKMFRAPHKNNDLCYAVIIIFHLLVN